MTNKLPISKDTFIEADERTHRGLQYDMFSHLYEKIDDVGCRNKKTDAIISGATGFAGGFSAVWLIMSEWWKAITGGS